MGPMLFTGLACLGAAIAVGLLSSRTSPPSPGAAVPEASRALAIVLMAFAQGIGVLGAVVGILAVVFGTVAEPSDGVYAVVPAIIGGIIGWEFIAWRRTSSDRGVIRAGETIRAGGDGPNIGTADSCGRSSYVELVEPIKAVP